MSCMDISQSVPSAQTISRGLREMMGSRPPRATLRLAQSMPETLALYIAGGPESPANDREAEARVDQLWKLLRGFLDEDSPEAFEAEIVTDSVFKKLEKQFGECGGGKPEGWHAAARIVFRYEERGETWYCENATDLTELKKGADAEIRGGDGFREYFEHHLAQPICEALARLVRREEIKCREERGLLIADADTPSEEGEQEGGASEPKDSATASSDDDEGRGSRISDDNNAPQVEDDPGEDALLETREPSAAVPQTKRLSMVPILVAALATLAAASLAAFIDAVSSGSRQPVINPHELQVSLQGGVVVDRSGVSISSNPIIDLGTEGGIQELASYAVVRPVRGLTGSLPDDLRLVIVIPRESLTNEVLLSAHLERSDDPIREFGQQSSDAVRISSRQADFLGVDVPSDLRVQVKRNGSPNWGEPRILPSAKWRECSAFQCELHLPLAQLARGAGDAIRLNFQTRAYELPKKNEPMLVLDMEQRRLGDRFTTDGELQIAPRDRVLYSFYVANRGSAPAHNVVLRLALPEGARLIPGSVRASITGDATPAAIEDNFANGGIRYARFKPEAEATYRALAEVQPSEAGGELYPYWIVRSDETAGSEFYDSVTTSVE